MSFSQLVIQFQCTSSSILGSRESLSWRERAITRQYVVGISESCKRKRITWIDLNGLFEIFDSFCEPFRSSLVPIKTALEIMLICSRVFSVPLGELFLLRSAQF